MMRADWEGRTGREDAEDLSVILRVDHGIRYIITENGTMEGHAPSWP
jgi:hypothetical protein